tara:strand:- start:244 stop:516 length:273 start_codon:yes stop_codon:yes gene_type:complete
LKLKNFFNMYKYKLIQEQEDKAEKFQKERIEAFDKIENKLDELKKLLRQGKIRTIKYYRDNPKSFDVVIGTDLISDYFKDIFTLLYKEEN